MSMYDKLMLHFFKFMCAVILVVYVDYSIHTVGHNVQGSRHICSGAHGYNVRCIYSSASGHRVDCCELI